MTTKVSISRTKIIITDVTTGVTVQHLGVGASANAAWASNTGAREGVPDFGNLAFRSCLIDGTALGGWHPRALQRVNGRHGRDRNRRAVAGRHRVHHALPELVTDS